MTIEKAIRKAVTETKKHHAQGFRYSIITDGTDYCVLEFFGNSWATLKDGWKYLLNPRDCGNDLFKVEDFPGIFQNPIKTTVARILECFRQEITR